MSNTKKEWLNCLKGIVFASLATLAVFLIASLVIVAVLAEIENRLIRDIAVYGIMMVMYAVFFY